MEAERFDELAALGERALPARFALGPNYPNPFKRRFNQLAFVSR